MAFALSGNCGFGVDSTVRYDFDFIQEEGWLDASQNNAGPSNYEIIADPENPENNLLRFETAAGTNERPKVITQDRSFAAGRYRWRVFTPALGENDQASIGAFLWRDDQHEIDFEIYHGKQTDRELLNAQEDELIALLTVQASPYSYSVLIQREQWHLLELNLEVINPETDSLYHAEWYIDSILVGEFTLSYGPEVEFGVFCSLENLTFTGDHLPKQNNYALFDYFEFIPPAPIDLVLPIEDNPRDLDLDGMSDVWEVVYFGDTTTAIADEDIDGDNQSNLREASFGTDPLDENGYLKPEIGLVEDNVYVSWNSIAEFDYRLEFSSDLNEWEDIQENSFTSADGSLLSYTDLALSPEMRFYRLRPANHIDEDGDGLNKWEESLLETSDTNIDSDSDKMADIYEFNRAGLDPSIQNAFDPDLDAGLETGLVVRYLLDEQAGVVVRDASGNDFHAVISGSPEWMMDSERNTVLKLSESNNAVVTLPVNSLLNDLQDDSYTLSLWFRPESTPARDETEFAYALLMKRGRHNGLKYNFKSRFGTELWLRISDAHPNVPFNFDSKAVSLKSWYHVVMTVDKPNGRVMLYVNGLLENERTFPVETPTIGYEGPWRMGATSTNPNDDYHWRTNGLVDDVRIYSRALSAIEIMSLFALEK